MGGDSKFPSFQVSKEGGREGGPMRGLGTASDGANKHTNTQTDGHHDYMTDPDQWGRVSENAVKQNISACDKSA